VRAIETKVVSRFLRENIFAQYTIPCVIVSDQAIHFDNGPFNALLKRYSIIHCLITPYPLQSNYGHVEVSHKQIKQILEGRI